MCRKQLADGLNIRFWRQVYLTIGHFEEWSSNVSSFSEWNFLVWFCIIPELKLTQFQSTDKNTSIKYFRTEWYLHDQNMCEKLKYFEKRSANSSVLIVSWDLRMFLTILIMTSSLSSDAVPLSSVTICCVSLKYKPEAWTEVPVPLSDWQFRGGWIFYVVTLFGWDWWQRL